MAQKVSDILKKQDAVTVRGVEQILVALQQRYPQNLELKSAIRDMQDLAKQLEPQPAFDGGRAAREDEGAMQP